MLTTWILILINRELKLKFITLYSISEMDTLILVKMSLFIYTPCQFLTWLPKSRAISLSFTSSDKTGSLWRPFMTTVIQNVDSKSCRNICLLWYEMTFQGPMKWGVTLRALKKVIFSSVELSFLDRHVILCLTSQLKWILPLRGRGLRRWLLLLHFEG